MAAELAPVPAEVQQRLHRAVRHYHENMGLDVLEYLTEKRGFTEETISLYQLGEVTDPEPEHIKYEGNLVIPYLDRMDIPLTMRFRCIQDHDHREFHHGKYATIPNDPARMFGIKQLHLAEDEIHVTEGEIDSMTLVQCGLPAVAMPGASSFKAHHRRMLAGFSRIYVWGDPDEAGARFITDITSKMRQAEGVRIRGGDVNTVYMEHGKEALWDLINMKE